MNWWCSKSTPKSDSPGRVSAFAISAARGFAQTVSKSRFGVLVAALMWSGRSLATCTWQASGLTTKRTAAPLPKPHKFVRHRRARKGRRAESPFVPMLVGPHGPSLSPASLSVECVGRNARPFGCPAKPVITGVKRPVLGSDRTRSRDLISAARRASCRLVWWPGR